VVMYFGGFIFKGVFRRLWCTVYMRHHLYLVSSIPCVLRGWRLIIFADSKKKKVIVQLLISNLANHPSQYNHLPKAFKPRSSHNHFP